jgi:SAM-dependent methyltransferase
MKVLDVGGCRKAKLPFPEGYEHILLDIVDGEGVDIVADARDMLRLTPKDFDCLWVSHALEHFTSVELPLVLAGFKHVLKDDGLVVITVPDVKKLMQIMLSRDHDLLDTAYMAGEMVVTYADIIYGSEAILRAGHPFFKHHYGFSVKSLTQIMAANGFTGEAQESLNGWDIIYIGGKSVCAEQLKSP